MVPEDELAAPPIMTAFPWDATSLTALLRKRRYFSSSKSLLRPGTRMIGLLERASDKNKR
jgi:hypothetical protein